jgi:hemolysin activation/secretion protein
MDIEAFMSKISNIFLLSVCCQITLAAMANDTKTSIELQSIELSTGEFEQENSSQSIRIGKDLEIPGNRQQLIKQLQKHLTTKLSFEKIEEIKTTISNFFEQNNHPIVIVATPPQNITEGHLKLIVAEGKVGKIHLKGNNWTSDENILHKINLQNKNTIDTYALQQNIAWLNRNPFRHSSLFFHPGEESGSTDIDVLTQEQIPICSFGGVNTEGTEYTTRGRAFLGLHIGNLFNLDHQLRYQLTTAFNKDSFLAHSASYVLPFSWKHELLIFGGWAKGNGKIPTDSEKNKPSSKELVSQAISSQISGRYQIPFGKLFGDVIQEIGLGYDFKTTNNSLFFGSDVQTPTRADTNQFLISYMLNCQTKKTKTALLCEFFLSPFIMTKNQSLENYEKLRPGSNPKYAYGRISLEHFFTTEKQYEIKQFLTAQSATGNLLPSEMLGLGGWNSVRGYNDRVFNADNGVIYNLELYTPNLFKKNTATIKFLTFIDCGLGSKSKADEIQKKNDWLASAGIGVQCNIKKNCFLKADLGFPFHKIENEKKHTHCVHASARLSY